MNNQLSTMLLFIASVYFTGADILLIFFPRIWRKSGIFLNCGFAWALGNFFLMLLLYILSFANKLAWVNTLNFYMFAAFVFLVFLAVFALRTKRLMVDFPNLVAIMLILLFFLPLMRSSVFSFLNDRDAVTIWFLKAKSLFLESGIWGNRYFTLPGYEYSNKAYPLGMPLIIAAYSRLVNFFNDQTIQLYFLMYFINTVLFFYGAMQHFIKGISFFIRLLVTLSLFILPIFVIYSHNGYVDLPLSFIILVVLTIMLLVIEGKENYGFDYIKLYLPIAAAGGLIKNEGLAFFLVSGIFMVIAVMAEKRRVSKTRRDLIGDLFVTGVILAIVGIPFALWEYYKKSTGMDFYLNSARLSSLLFRAKFIFNYYLGEIVNTSKYGVVMIPIIFILIYEITHIAFRRRFVFLVPLTAILAQLSFYTAVYMVTPVNFDLQVTSSFERLLLQVLPSVFLIAAYYGSLIWTAAGSEGLKADTKSTQPLRD